MRAAKRPSGDRRARTIGVVSPAPPGSTLGNAVTAQRYAKIFRSLGLRAFVIREYGGQDFDALVALHARKSAPSVLAFKKRYPARPAVVVLTGTDLYRDIRTSRPSQRALACADALVVLQPLGVRALPARVRAKATSIVQSAIAARRPRRASPGFAICVLGHLRAEKDPLRAAYALRELPAGLPVRLTQAGAALVPRFAAAARKEEARNGRYRWIGEISRMACARLLAGSDLMVISSRIEGGANVLCEAVANGVAALASRIPGNVGILGPRYPGYYAAGDTRGLATIMRRTVVDRRYYERLRKACRELQPLVTPRRERESWERMLLRVGIKLSGRRGASGFGMPAPIIGMKSRKLPRT